MDKSIVSPFVLTHGVDSPQFSASELDCFTECMCTAWGFISATLFLSV